MSATRGMWMLLLMAPRALAAAMSGTATRTISQPAASRRWIWSTVAGTSPVLVEHMDWMLTGAPPPTGTPPTMIRFVIVSHLHGCEYQGAPALPATGHTPGNPGSPHPCTRCGEGCLPG